MPRLELHLLGTPSVEKDGQEVRISRRKALALLAYLAVTRQTHTRDALATLFWPEQDQIRARNSLRGALVSLRKALGERDSYWLEFDSAPEEIHMSGSLADDLTDIYFDLLQGLELVDDAWPHRAAQAWQSTYRLHWGQHLVDAERHLYALKVRNLLALDKAS